MEKCEMQLASRLPYSPESAEAGNVFTGVYSTVMVGGILHELDNLQLLCAARTNGLLAGS